MTRFRSAFAVTSTLTCAALLVSGAGASAAPATSRTLTYHLTDCVGAPGTPTSLDGVKQPSEAAALHLTDGSGNFVFMKAVDAATGAVLFATPGFDHNGLPTVTCDLIHPVTGAESIVTGLISPVP
jgi:hypothetical protein